VIFPTLKLSPYFLSKVRSFTPGIS
jgi:hypothetical protein